MAGWTYDEEDLEDRDKERPDETADLPPPPRLPSVRKRRDRQQVKQVREGLDPSVLQVFPPHLIDKLGWLQQDWLVARLMTYSDRQACLHLGIKYRTLRKWISDHKEFLAAYELVTLDPLNFAAAVNRIITLKSAVETLRLMDHPSVKVRIKMIDIHARTTTRMAEAEAKRSVQIGQINQFGTLPPAEWARKVLEMKIIDDDDPRIIDGATVVSGTNLDGLLPLPAPSPGDGPVDEDSGRDDFEDAALRSLVLAEGPPLPLDDEEVFDLSEG